MWFKNQSGRYFNSDKLEAMGVNFVCIEGGKEIWKACAEKNGYEETLFSGSEKECQEWVEQLARMINQFKAGVL